MRSDKEMMDFLDAFADYDIGVDPDDDMRRVFKITGPINDREWREVGRGSSLRAALDAAMAKHEADEADRKGMHIGSHI